MTVTGAYLHARRQLPFLFVLGQREVDTPLAVTDFVFILIEVVRVRDVQEVALPIDVRRMDFGGADVRAVVEQGSIADVDLQRLARCQCDVVGRSGERDVIERQIPGIQLLTGTGCRIGMRDRELPGGPRKQRFTEDLHRKVRVLNAAGQPDFWHGDLPGG
jgi:hypothetical protein